MKLEVLKSLKATPALVLLLGGIGIASAQSDLGPDSPATSTDTSEAADSQGGAAVGQAPEGHAAAPASSNRLIEEIVVTAQKREEDIQTVPIAITAFSGEKLDAIGIQSPHDLPKITPGLTFTSSAAYNIVYLRGVGSDAFLPAADQDVPTYLDGVALVQGEGSQDTLGRVKRVEVLKGPQGTLFGRNSTGGAISIITPDPESEFSGDINIDTGNLGTLNGLAYVNVPIIDGLAATVSGYSFSHNTYERNVIGPTVDTYSRGGRVKMLWHVTDDLSFNGSALYGETSNNASMAKENIRVSPYLSAIIPVDKNGDYRFSEDVTGGIVQYNYLFAGGADWKLPWAEIKGIGSDQKVLATYANYDYDGSPVPFVSFQPIDEFSNQVTGELQLLSTSDTPFAKYLSFVAGAYYLQGKGGFPSLDLDVAGPSGLTGALPGLTSLFSNINGLLAGLGQPPISLVTGPATAVSGGILTSKSISGYFQTTLHVNQFIGFENELNLVLGARVQKETRGLENNRLGVLNPAVPTRQEITLLRFSVPDTSAVQVPLKLAVQWYPFKLTQLYGSFSRGFTAPTYNTVNFFSNPDKLKPQVTDSYELGVKTQMFNETLTFDAAGFYIRQKELLTGFASITSGGVVRFDNVPSARILGLEGDATWQVLPDWDPGLVLLGSISYLNAKYTSYPNARGYDVQSGLSFGDGAFLPGRDVSGNDIVRTPHLSYNLAVNQSIPMGHQDRLEIAVESNYSAKFYFDPQNASAFENPAYRIIDARASYFYTPWGVELTAYGKNLTQAHYYNSLFLLDPGAMVTRNDPRTYGIRLKYSF